jgi:hypothetical protein
MAIKIPGAAEVGLGRRTPGAIAEGLPRPVREIPGIGFDIARAGLQFVGAVVSEQQIRAEKVDRAARDEAVSRANTNIIGLQGSMARESKSILANPDLDVAGRKTAFNKMLAETDGEFRKIVPQELQVKLEPMLKRTSEAVTTAFADAIAGQVKDARVADLETTLREVETFTSENPGFEQEAKKQAHILIDASPEAATIKVERKKKIDRTIDSNTVKNELVLGDPKVVLERLREKTKSGAFANYRGLTSADRTAFTSQAQDAATTNTGFKIANDLWDTQGPKDKFDLIDIEKLTETARGRATSERAAKAAVTRLRERATLHNQARNATITSHEAAIWEAHDNKVKSAGIFKMREFTDLPAPERKAIERELELISERMSKGETLTLKANQRDRYDELVSDPALLRATDISAEFRNRKIDESGRNALQKLKEVGTLQTVQAKEAQALLRDAERNGLYDPDDDVNNSRLFTADVETLKEYIVEHPNADPFAFVEELLKPPESQFIKKLLKVLTFGGPTTRGFKTPREIKAERIRGLTGKTLDRAGAQRFLDLANGDPVKARELAREDGFSF